MYTMTCDGHPLLDARDDAYILGSPKIKTEVNTVGEGSFKIYFNHPNINKLKPLRSVFEVEDEYGVIFRGRMTEDTKDFDNCKDVDLEGAMSYFNDSVVRPYVFPDDFKDDAEYQAAVAETPEQAAIDGGVVRFLLKWYIDRHNEQVEPFQQFKLGNVTVYDKNNYIERASSDYSSAWKEISEKLFNSSLGGFLCIRYERDGNYIDYLREFTEISEQGITYGENMLDISQNTNANETYSAIIPLGKEGEFAESSGDVHEGLYVDIVDGSTVKRRLTIDVEDLPDGDITIDIAKKGDTLYSRKAVSNYGWRYAPIDETTWDDITEPENLQAKGVEFLEGDSSKLPNTIKVVAVDLNCTDSQIRSFRIYRKIPVNTLPHGVNDNFDLTSLECDLLNPQNTKITVGKTVTTITKQVDSVKSDLKTYAKNEQVAEGFKKTKKFVEETESSITEGFASTYATKEELRETAATLKITDEDIEMVVSGKYATIDELGNVEAKLNLAVMTDEEGKLQSSIYIGANLLTIETDNFTLDESGRIIAKAGEIAGFEISGKELIFNDTFESHGDDVARIVARNLDYDNKYETIFSHYGLTVGVSDSGDSVISNVEISNNGIGFQLGDVRANISTGSYTSGEKFISIDSGTLDYGLLKGNWRIGEVVKIVDGFSEVGAFGFGPVMYNELPSGFLLKVNDGYYGQFVGAWYLESGNPVSSTRSAKENITALSTKHETLFDNLKPCSFEYIGEHGRTHYGLILDELRDAMNIAEMSTNECAAYCLINPDDPNGYGGIRYEELIALCINEIQKIKKQLTKEKVTANG